MPTTYGTWNEQREHLKNFENMKTNFALFLDERNLDIKGCLQCTNAILI